MTESYSRVSLKARLGAVRRCPSGGAQVRACPGKSGGGISLGAPPSYPTDRFTASYLGRRYFAGGPASCSKRQACGEPAHELGPDGDDPHGDHDASALDELVALARARAPRTAGL